MKENDPNILFFHAEFNTDVDVFRKFVKEQKAVSTDMSHLSLPKLHQKIKSDVEGLSTVVQQLSSGIKLLSAFCEKVPTNCCSRPSASLIREPKTKIFRIAKLI